MLYLTLNQAFKNVINNDVPDDVMKIIYKYVISLNNKIKINNLFDIFNYDYKYEQEIKQKNVPQLKDQFKNLNGHFKQYVLKCIDNRGKRNSMVKQDYVDKLCYYNHWNKWNNKFTELKYDKVKYYNVDTKKYITNKEYQNIKNQHIEDYKKDLRQHLEEFYENNPQYKINRIEPCEFKTSEVVNYAFNRMKKDYKKSIITTTDFDYGYKHQQGKYNYYDSYLQLDTDHLERMRALGLRY